MFGGFVHELLGTRNDLQTALLLYRSAWDVLFKNYNAYPTFNASSQKFRKDFEKFPSLKPSKVEKEYVLETIHQKDLKQFLQRKILSLTRAIRPREVKREIKRLKISKEVQKLATKSRPSNFLLILNEGMIGEKVPKREYYSLAKALEGDNPTPEQKKVAQLGAGFITLFAASKLGLLPPPQNYSPIGMEMGVRLGLAAGDAVAISFQVPQIKKDPALNKLVRKIKVLNQKNEVIHQSILPIIAPMSDIAEEAVFEYAADRALRQGSRLAWKHITAIGTSIFTYKSMIRNQTAEFIAKQAALFQYIALAKTCN